MVVENLRLKIESVLDSEGFKRLQQQLRKAEAGMDRLRASAAQTGAQVRSMGKAGGLGGRLGVGGGMSFADDPMANVRNMSTPNIRKFGRLRRTFFKAASSSKMLSGSLGRLGAITNFAGRGFSKLRAKVASATGAIAAQIPTLRSLQMTLLGVQFQLLSLAFIFGGLMGSALGAVGVFKILGNTLKMFFLPAALDILPIALSIQDALLGVDEETRRLIGRIFFAIATFAALGSILAFTTNGFLSVLNVVKGLAFPLRFLIASLTGAGSGATSLLGTLSSIGGGSIISGIMSVASSIASAIPIILVVIGLVMSLVTIFQRFPGVASFLMNALSALFSTIVSNLAFVLQQVTSVISGLLNMLTGFITVVLGVLTGDLDKAKRGFQELLFGIKQLFIDTTVNMLNFVIDKINRIVSKIPGVDQPIGQISAPDLGRDFTPNNNNQQGQVNLQNNNIQATLNIQDPRETPEETGRKFGQGLAQGLNYQNSNISSGT